jgi:hypothetical protein
MIRYGVMIIIRKIWSLYCIGAIYLKSMCTLQPIKDLINPSLYKFLFSL